MLTGAGQSLMLAMRRKDAERTAQQMTIEERSPDHGDIEDKLDVDEFCPICGYAIALHGENYHPTSPDEARRLEANAPMRKFHRWGAHDGEAAYFANAGCMACHRLLDNYHPTESEARAAYGDR